MFDPIFHAGAHLFSLHALLLMATAVGAALLGIRVVAREEGSGISWLFFALAGSVAWWLFGRGMSATAPAAANALRWTRLSYLALPVVPAALVQFASVAIGTKRRISPLLIATWIVSAAMTALCVSTDTVIAGVWHYRWGFYPRYGRGGAIFIVFMVSVVTASIAGLLRVAHRLPPGRQRQRLQQFALGYAVGFLGAADFLGAYGIAVIPIGHFAVLGTVFVIGRTIRKHQLFDITPAFAAKNIVSTMNDALVVADDEGHIRIVNDALVELTGYAQEELLGQPLGSLMPPSASPDRELRTKHGELVPVSVSLSTLVERGRAAGVVVIARDLRERLRTEAALREQELRLRTEEVRRKAERQYRTLVESISQGIIQLDREFIVRYINVPGALMVGAMPEEIVGRPVFEFVGEGLRTVMQAKAVLRRRGISDRYEVELQPKRGGPIWVEVTGSPVFDLNGDVIGSIGVLTDFTERRRFQQRLAASAAEWQETFDAIQMPIVIVDGEGRVRRANRTAQQVAEAGADGGVGRRVRDFGAGALWREIDRIARAAESAERAQFVEPDGERTWDIVVDVLRNGVADKQVVVSARDITALVELQQSLRRSETMSALGSLVGGVAHEVRNPLFAISATLDSFEDLYGERAEYRHFAGVMREQIARLSDLMSGLLEFGRPAPASLSPRPVAPIVEKAISLCAAEAKAAGVEIAYRPAPEISIIGADERRLLQAFRNLIHNAVQHSPPRSRVTVRTERTTCAAGDPWLLCTVTDEGPGFDPADLQSVFEPFFTRRRGGTGLGLSITRAVVEQHRGKIVAANRPEGGAIVSVELPIAAA